MKFHLGDLAISSPAFDHGGAIPDEYTTEGEDVSPELAFSGVPAGTVELALVCHDPDAPLTDGYTHWVVWGIPPDAGGIARRGGGAFTEGTNDFGNVGYGGPAPPPGHGRHHYFFHLYALSRAVDAGAGTTRPELLAQIDEAITEQARIVGTYER
jgi:Raf kinase inhibitor-like YbhB/YbcL family protein